MRATEAAPPAGLSRWGAFGLHLAISAAVIVGLAQLMLCTWYANGLFEYAGADKFLLRVAAISIAAGPLLTLMVFRLGKPGLRRDLCLIGLAQLAFLGGGLGIIWQSRPVFLVAIPERFILVFANEIDARSLPVKDGAMPRSSLPWLGPELVGTRRPSDPDEHNQLIEELLAGRDLPLFPRHYVPFEEIAPAMLAGSEPASSLLRLASGDKERKMVASILSMHPSTARWVPITSLRGTASMLVDADSGIPLRVIDLDPSLRSPDGAP